MCELSFFDSSLLLLPLLNRSKFKIPLNEKKMTPNDKMPTGIRTRAVLMARSRYPTKQMPVMLLPSTSLSTIMPIVRTNGNAHAIKCR